MPFIIWHTPQSKAQLSFIRKNKTNKRTLAPNTNSLIIIQKNQYSQ